MSAASMVQQLGELSNEMEAEYDDCAGLPAPSLVVLLLALKEARAGLDMLYRRVSNDLLDEVGNARSLTVEGVGVVEFKRSNKRTEWDHDGLTRKVVAMALDERICDEQTGEYEPAHEAVARVLSECSRPSWRVTPLKERGLDVDEYCRTEWGARSVVLP